MPTTTQIPGGPLAVTDDRMYESIPFESTCPDCAHPQPQRGFSRAALSRLLNGGHPVEAYCVMCNVFWSITADERIAIASDLTL